MKFLEYLVPSGLFTESFMLHAFISGTMVAIVSGLVGFFVILRGSSFVAHVLPKVGFAGAAGAVLFGIDTLSGLVVFALAGSASIGVLGKKGRHDVVTALTLIGGLGLGALFLALNDSYAEGAYAILFGQLVGVSLRQVMETGILTVISLIFLAILYRPLLFASVMKDNARARGVNTSGLEMAFLAVVGIATAITVPIVGALLSFSLMVGPAATARFLTHHPVKAMGYSVVIAVCTVWLALLLGYDTNWPIGFFISTITAVVYGVVRVSSRNGARSSYQTASSRGRAA